MKKSPNTVGDSERKSKVLYDLSIKKSFNFDRRQEKKTKVLMIQLLMEKLVKKLKKLSQ